MSETANDQDTREHAVPPDHTVLVIDLLSELQAAQRHANELADRINQRVEALEQQVAELVRELRSRP